MKGQTGTDTHLVQGLDEIPKEPGVTSQEQEYESQNLEIRVQVRRMAAILAPGSAVSGLLPVLQRRNPSFRSIPSQRLSDSAADKLFTGLNGVFHRFS